MTKFANKYEGEYMISELIRKKGCYAHFEYNYLYAGGTNIVLQVISYNPVDKSYRLFHQMNGADCMDVLQKMYDFTYKLYK